MKKILSIIFTLAITFSLFGQSPKVSLKDVSLDSLAGIISKRVGVKVYFISESKKNLQKFSVDAEESDVITAIENELKRNNYSLTVYNGSLFILKGTGFIKTLPEGFFSEKSLSSSSENGISDLTGKDSKAMSVNKVYEIGDKMYPKKSGKCILSGHVKNIDTGEPVPGAVVVNNKTGNSVVSDIYGTFRIILSPGKNEIRISGYGMEESILSLEVYNDGNLEIFLKERVYALKGVVVSAENMKNLKSSQIGMEKVRIDRIKRVPAAFGEADVMKIVLTLPGVKSVGEASGGFNVRGGATDQNLILFNEGTIYNPTHLFGLFSAFNPDIVNDIELYKSSIPAQYGGRISSVLEVNSREGNSKKITGSAGIGLLTGRFHLEGPLVKNKTNFIIGARTTYSDWILKLLPDNSEYRNGTASFYDLSGSLSHKINSKNTLYFYGYYSHDGFKFSMDTSYTYKNLNLALKWRGELNEKNNFTVSAGYDQYNYTTYDKGNPVNSYSMSFVIRQMFLKSNFRWLVSEKNTISYGFNGTLYDLSPGKYMPEGSESLVTPRELQNEKAFEGALFISDKWDLTDKLTLDLGLRYSFFSAFGPKDYYTYSSESDRSESTVIDYIHKDNWKPIKFYGGPEYRLSMRYSITDLFSVKAGFNSMRQYIHMLSNTTAISPTDIWKLSDANIVPQKGWQAAFGLYTTTKRAKAELSLEAYYKSMDDYLDYKSGAVLTMNPTIERDVVRTEGKAYGVEFMIKKPLGKLNGWMSYTYSKTMLRDKSDRGDNAVNRGEWYAAAYDKPHDFKVVGNYRFTHRFSVSMNVDYSTGRPITVPISKYFYGNGYRFFYSDRNSYRIPDYFRLDLSVNIEPSHYLKWLTHSTITFGVYNVTGRKNAYSIFFDANSGSSIKGYMLSIFGSPIPYINYNIKF